MLIFGTGRHGAFSLTCSAAMRNPRYGLTRRGTKVVIWMASAQGSESIHGVMATGKRMVHPNLRLPFQTLAKTQQSPVQRLCIKLLLGSSVASICTRYTGNWVSDTMHGEVCASWSPCRLKHRENVPAPAIATPQVYNYAVCCF